MNESIEPLKVFDSDIAEIAFNSDNPSFELQLVKLGISRAEARAKTKLITLLKKKPTNFDELEELVKAWEDACGYQPNSRDLAAVDKLLWSEEEDGSMRFKEARKKAEERGWKLEKIDGVNVKYGGYKTGYLVTDGTRRHRWAKLGDFVLNCIEENRDIDGFLTR